MEQVGIDIICSQGKYLSTKKPYDKRREAFGWILNLTAPVASAEIAWLAILRLESTRRHVNPR